MLTPQTRNQIISILDQESAAVADMLDCEEYRRILAAMLSQEIQGLMKHAKRPDVPPFANVSIEWNIMDMITVLRLAQVKLCEAMLEGELT